jgi:hypothetical protein
MATNSKIRDHAGRFLPGHPIGAATRWKDVSGNPAGRPRARLAFEEAFYAALMGQGSPEEAAELLWQAARNKEPWAIQNLLGRIAPQQAQLKITHEVNDGFDFRKLSDSELAEIGRILERASGAPKQITGGTVPARLENVHPAGVADC